MKKILSIMILLAVSMLSMNAANDKGQIITRNVNVQEVGNKLVASFDIVLDQVQLSSNHQLFVTPYVEGQANQRAFFPTVLINGRNMQYVYERSGLNREKEENYNKINQVVRRKNGKEQAISYTESIDMGDWMKQGDINFRLAIDSCGCGNLMASGKTEPMVFNLVPRVPVFYTAFITPPVSEQRVAIHEGRARVQFEVDRTELHTEPYICKSGQRIDNRAQLKVICDSIDYALSDPNVEIANINICGYASPESPYTHNDFLSTNRSRALAEYLGERYKLPKESCTFSAVPENWDEFRELVVDAKDITEKQRQDLLELIDKPAYGPSDYDAKETTLKTDARFAKLYRTKILPVWFPQLRCTKFAISTRLKPASDQQLAEIIKKTPELLNLNQIFRVARLYEEGSEQYCKTFDIALRFYGDNPTANLNAAVAAIKASDYDKAERLLQKAGNTPEAENARGIVAAQKGDKTAAIRHFEAAGNLPEAKNNLNQLK